MDYYVIDSGELPRKTSDTAYWLSWMNRNLDCYTLDTVVGDYRIGTVFIGVGQDDDVEGLFETREFYKLSANPIEQAKPAKTSSWKEAVVLHNKTVQIFRQALGRNDWFRRRIDAFWTWVWNTLRKEGK